MWWFTAGSGAGRYMGLERCGPTLNQSSTPRSLVSKLGLSLSGKPLSEISRLSPYSAPPLHLNSASNHPFFGGVADFYCVNWRFVLPYFFRSISGFFLMVSSKANTKRKNPLVIFCFILVFFYLFNYCLFLFHL